VKNWKRSGQFFTESQSVPINRMLSHPESIFDPGKNGGLFSINWKSAVIDIFVVETIKSGLSNDN